MLHYNFKLLVHIISSQFRSFLYNRILLKGVLIPKLLSNPFASCLFTNLDFLNPQSGHFDNIISLPFFGLKIFEFKFSFFFYIFYNKLACLVL